MSTNMKTNILDITEDLGYENIIAEAIKYWNSNSKCDVIVGNDTLGNRSLGETFDYSARESYVYIIKLEMVNHITKGFICIHPRVQKGPQLDYSPIYVLDQCDELKDIHNGSVIKSSNALLVEYYVVGNKRNKKLLGTKLETIFKHLSREVFLPTDNVELRVNRIEDKIVLSLNNPKSNPKAVKAMKAKIAKLAYGRSIYDEHGREIRTHASKQKAKQKKKRDYGGKRGRKSEYKVEDHEL